MKAVLAKTMRSLDQQTIQGGYCSGWELMCRAGTAIAEKILTIVKEPEKYAFCIVTGKGNNAGDGFVVAQYLYQHIPGADIRIHCLCQCPEEDLKGDALTAFLAMDPLLKNRIKFSLLPCDLDPDTIVIDAILGTGFAGKLKENYRNWIKEINQSSCPVMAVDIPSGLSADTGEIPDLAIRADFTFTLALPKCGLLLGRGPEYCGRIMVCPIGIPDALLETVDDHLDAVHSRDAAAYFQPEPWDSYKNRKGHVLIVGSSADYPGAAFLSGEAALRAGSGLLTVAVPRGIPFYSRVPKALIVRQIHSSDDRGDGGYYTGKDAEPVSRITERMDAVAIGPGLSGQAGVPDFLRSLLPLIRTPLILDADALNIIAENPDLFPLLKPDTVLTPHPGEMLRLMQAAKLDYHAKTRTEQAESLARFTGTVVVLKGPATVIAAPDGRIAVNLSGSPVLATAGSGDLLTGIICSVAGRRYPVFEAACAGVYLHGLLGELCHPDQMSQGAGIIADDLLQKIGPAILFLREKELKKRKI